MNGQSGFSTVAANMIPAIEVAQQLQIFASEFFGTTLLMFFGCVGQLGGFNVKPTDLTLIALVWGFTITAIITIFSHIGEAHFNPAVTVGAICFGRISLAKASVYIAAQCLGSLFGSWLVTFVASCSFCVTTVNSSSLTLPVAVFAEFVGTTFLMFAVCSLWDSRTARHRDSAPIKIGFTIAVIIFAIGNLTGASLNPARSLGPAVVNGEWENHWIYWVAPLSAGMFTSMLYKMVFLKLAELPKV